MPYDRYPAVDEDYLFPPEVRGANGLAPEFRNQVVPLTQTQRNNLTGDELWDGRLVMNLTTRRIDMYDLSSGEWLQMTTEPAGIVKEYGGATAPDFHVMADGSVYPRTGVYAALFAVYGTQYNTGGELSTEFRVPDRRGRTAVGVDPGDPNLNALGKKYGTKVHTLSAAEMPSHNHGGGTGGQSANHVHTGSTAGEGGHMHSGEASSVQGVAAGAGTSVLKVWPDVLDEGTVNAVKAGTGNHGHAFTSDGANVDHAHAVGTSGSDGSHENMPPYLVMNYIITL